MSRLAIWRFSAIALATAVTVGLAPAIAQSDASAQDEQVAANQESSAFSLALGPSGADFGPPAAGFGGPAGARFNLTDDQLEKLSSAKNKMKDAAGPKMLELGSLQRHLKDVLTKPSVDRADAVATQKKINGLKNDLADLRLSFKLDTADIFTPEQKQQMRRRALMGSFGGGRHHGRRGHMGRHHGGFKGQGFGPRTGPQKPGGAPGAGSKIEVKPQASFTET